MRLRSFIAMFHEPIRVNLLGVSLLARCHGFQKCELVCWYGALSFQNPSNYYALLKKVTINFPSYLVD